MRQLMLVYPADPRAATRSDEYMFGPDLLVAPVIEAGATSRSLYLPPFRWIDFWRSVSIGRREAPGLPRLVILRGGRQVTVPAPANQLPMFVRAGAALGLLPADVQTLIDYGSGVVHLRDRDGRRTLIAWPLPGSPAATTSLADGATARPRPTPGGGWLLRTQQTRIRTITLQVALAKRPCVLQVNGRTGPFSSRRVCSEPRSGSPAGAFAQFRAVPVAALVRPRVAIDHEAQLSAAKAPTCIQARVRRGPEATAIRTSSAAHACSRCGLRFRVNRSTLPAPHGARFGLPPHG
jgi:hypothetical protein